MNGDIERLIVIFKVLRHLRKNLPCYCLSYM